MTSLKSLISCSKRLPNLTMPAQLTSAEGVSPNFLRVSATDFSSVTSVGNATELGILDSTSSSISLLRSNNPTLYPF